MQTQFEDSPAAISTIPDRIDEPPPTMPSTITIAHRFCGPPDSGNGGYSCGVLGKHFSGAVEVTLRKPPPLDSELQLVEVPDGIELRDGDTLIGQARASELKLTAPKPPSLDDAIERSKRYPAFDNHVFPTCFVCGPKRTTGDGLRIFVGPGDGDEIMAAPFAPSLALPHRDGKLAPEAIWAALDCPGYFAVDRGLNAKALLGRMTAQLFHPVDVTAKHIIIGWPAGIDGRKLYAGTALFSADGTLLAQSDQVWIRIP